MTPNEVTEANHLLSLVANLKLRISQIEEAFNSITAARVEIVFSPKEKVYSKIPAEVTGDSAITIAGLIKADLQMRVDEQIKRLVELGVEAPDD